MSRARSQPCTGRFPFHFVHINREGEAGQKREGGGESNKGQEKGKGGGERRAQSGGVCPRRMNEIFISDGEETRLLSRIFSLTFTLLPTYTPATFPLFTLSFTTVPFLSLSSLYCITVSFTLSLYLFLLPFSPFSSSLNSGPLVEVREFVLSICRVLLFLNLCL